MCQTHIPDNNNIICNNDNDNDNEIDLFRHHNWNNTNIKVISKQMTMLDKCNCIWCQEDHIATIKFVDGIWPPVIIL